MKGMMAEKLTLSLDQIREQIIGRDFCFETPYGTRLLTYADFTASGRAVSFIEKYIIHIQRAYANTHTEDDTTGRTMTGLLHRAERIIKQSFNAKNECIIAQGSGSTGAISKFQEIIGVRIPPATRKRMNELKREYFQKHPEDLEACEDLEKYTEKNKPVVFIGPYEHHSNDIMWREGFAEVVMIGLTEDGMFDLDDLEQQLAKPKYKNRTKIGSFSAASNVTGLKSPVYQIARLLHKYDALACFDFAASSPYVEINMNQDPDSFFDAIYISPHKFLGGPGSSGILVFNKRVYDPQLPPTFAAGGTVDYVSPTAIDYTRDIETREKAGTPGIIQTIRAALAIDLKNHIGQAKISQIEEKYCTKAMERLTAIPNVQILGNLDSKQRIPIFSFLIRHKDKYLHPKLGTKLLNDLFGIQSRAGCSCAGVYGHLLLDIDQNMTEQFREVVHKGLLSIKPGWIRVNFHYAFSDVEFDFILDAIEFIAKHGYKFIPFYKIDLHTGDWHHHSFRDKDLAFNPIITNILDISTKNCFESEDVNQAQQYRQYLKEAYELATTLPDPEEFQSYGDALAEKLRWFYFSKKV